MAKEFKLFADGNVSISTQFASALSEPAVISVHIKLSKHV